MAAGDETISGPHKTNTAGVTAAGAAMDAAWDGTDDKYVIVPSANGREFWVIHIEGQ